MISNYCLGIYIGCKLKRANIVLLCKVDHISLATNKVRKVNEILPKKLENKQPQCLPVYLGVQILVKRRRHSPSLFDNKERLAWQSIEKIASALSLSSLIVFSFLGANVGSGLFLALMISMYRIHTLENPLQPLNTRARLICQVTPMTIKPMLSSHVSSLPRFMTSNSIYIHYRFQRSA